jgi:hypothetical protein
VGAADPPIPEEAVRKLAAMVPVTLLAVFAVLYLNAGCNEFDFDETDNTSPGDAALSVLQLATINELIHLGPAVKLSNGHILLGGATSTTAAVYKSTNAGASWSQVGALSAGGSGHPVMGMTQIQSGQVYAITDNTNNLYLSQDYGSNWGIAAGVADFDIPNGKAILRSRGNILYILAGDPSVLHQTSDQGTTWTSKSVSGSYASLFEIASGSYLVAGYSAGGTAPTPLELLIAPTGTNPSFTKTDLGLTDLEQSPVLLINKDNGDILVIGKGFRKWISSNKTDFTYAGQVASDNAVTVYSGLKTSSGLIVVSTGSMIHGAKVYISHDDGNTFEDAGVTDHVFNRMIEVNGDTLLGFSMQSFDGSHPTRIYRITVN